MTSRNSGGFKRVRERRHRHASRLAIVGAAAFTFGVTALFAQASGGYLTTQPLSFWGILERNALPIMTSLGASVLLYVRLYWRQDNFEREQKTDREAWGKGLATKADRELMEQALQYHKEGMQQLTAGLEGLRKDLIEYVTSLVDAGGRRRGRANG